MQNDDRISAAKKRLVRRILLADLVLLLSVLGLYKERHSVLYMLTWQEPTDIGDVRELYVSGTRELPASPGTYVRVRNLLVTHDELKSSSGKYRFFFCPIFNILVRTTRPLPEPPIRISRVEIPEGLEFLVEQNKVEIIDFGRSFDAEGMLLRLRDMPGFESGIEAFALERLRLSQEEIEEAWGLLDGETPQNQYLAMFMLALAVLGVLVSTGMVLAQVSNYRREVTRANT